jgi:hypothetical protein
MSNPTPRDASPSASDDDRIQVAQLLSEAASHGRLTLDEYEARLTKAYGAVGYDELERLTYDLPEAMEYRRGKSKPAPSTMLMAILRRLFGGVRQGCSEGSGVERGRKSWPREAACSVRRWRRGLADASGRSSLSFRELACELACERACVRARRAPS